jgi:hypothetical protein
LQLAGALVPACGSITAANTSAPAIETTPGIQTTGLDASSARCSGTTSAGANAASANTVAYSTASTRSRDADWLMTSRGSPGVRRAPLVEGAR